MFTKIVDSVKANKNTIIRKGAIVVGTIVGLAIVGIIVSQNNGTETEDGENLSPIDETVSSN